MRDWQIAQQIVIPPRIIAFFDRLGAPSPAMWSGQTEPCRGEPLDGRNVSPSPSERVNLARQLLVSNLFNGRSPPRAAPLPSHVPRAVRWAARFWSGTRLSR